jgi:hypothetical protein
LKRIYLNWIDFKNQLVAVERGFMPWEELLLLVKMKVHSIILAILNENWVYLTRYRQIKIKYILRGMFN